MSNSRMSNSRKTLAFFFGGKSPEHDVSIVSGLQALAAVDSDAFDAFPVYVTAEGRWLTGDVLRQRDHYLPDENALRKTVEVTLDVAAAGRGVLLPKKAGLFGGGKPLSFDVAVLCFHGLIGEDGGIQGLFDLAGVAYTGMRGMASSLLMDKVATKLALKALDIPCLPYAVIRRPAEGFFPPEDVVAAAAEKVGFPCIVKPVHLGSSIGVAKAGSVAEIMASLPPIFEYDNSAILEPFVPNLVEYNVAVSRAFGAVGEAVRTSAIERPKATAELLDFKQKYLSSGDGKSGKAGGGGTKSPGQISQGMLSLTREINPALSPETERKIREWSGRLFDALGGAGAPRIDFLGDAKTGEIWLNEVNPIPGSLAYFLWEAAQKPVLFTNLVTALVREALILRDSYVLPRDPVPVAARLFRR